MAYASVTYTSASGTTFALTNSSGDPIEYLRQNDISVTVNGVLKTLTTDYTFNTAGTAIVLNTAVSGATVLIARTTDIADATVSFTAGSTLTAQDLNNSDKQNRFALQEFSDIYDSLRTGTGDLSTLGGFIGSSEAWTSDNAHSATTGAIDVRVDSKIDTALTTDVVAGDSITVTDNSPSSGQITIGVTNASISTAKLVDSSVTTAKIADGNVTTAKILDANVTTAKILDANVTTAKIADNAVTSAKIADGTIVAGDIAADAVTTAKILDSNVTTGKIADGAVTTAKLADSSVTSAKIVDGTIVAGDLASDSVTTAKIVDSNVTTAKINDSAVTTGKIADSAVTAIKIADGVITSAKLNAATVVTAAEQAACTPDDVTFFTTSASDGRYVNVTGDSMTGALAMGSNKITGLGAPTANADAATKQYVDTSVAAGVGDADYGDITVSGTGTVWTIDSGVVTSAKIADGTIVDGDINAAAAIAGTKISPDFGSQNVTTTGTVTGASLSPSSSTAPTNGVYLPAANTVAISTNGSGRLFVDASGNVGVGATPVVPLDVQAAQATQRLYSTTGANTSHIQFRNTGGIAYVGLDNSTGGAFGAAYGLSLTHTGAYPITFVTNGSERLRITSDGKVGIGTSAPVDTLHVVGSARFGDGTNFAGVTANASGATFEAAAGSANVLFKTGGTERLRITSAGLVGIGTSSPSAALHVVTSGAGQIRYFDGTVTGAFGSFGSGNEVFLGSGKALAFTTNGITSSETRMTIDTSGRVGIGTTSPAEKFDVRRSGFGNVAFFADDSASGLFIKTASGVAGLDSRNNTTALNFLIDGSEKARLDTSGRLLVGTSTNVDSDDGYQPSIQVAGIAAKAAISIARYQASNPYGAQLFLQRSKTDTIGAQSIMSSGDEIGLIQFEGSDGTKFRRAAGISAQVDGTPGSGDMPGRLVFSTTADGASSPTERMRITQSGRITLGGQTNEYGHLTFTNGSVGTTNSMIWLSLANTAHYYLQFEYNSGGRIGSITTNGTAVAFNTSSDYRLKENIAPVVDGIERLKQLKPSRFNFISHPEKTVDGFIAHEVQAIVPEAINGEKDAIDEDGKPIYQGIDQSKLVPLLTAALQETVAKIESLEARLTAAGI